ncbi:hypothetical protein BKA62DRAFT_829026 [Auriculariales sp. MPI-PUGE-AT-0066]|nr:hypothetical protein BKA62DRAFT_829026 [Auriculariales sp. MPI-PUGE-AT-0066]
MSAANNVNEAAWINEAKGHAVVGPAETPVPGPGELLVRTEAIAFHPLDAKMQLYNFFDLAYPAIFGNSVGGTVVSVGPGVEQFKPSDAVVATTPLYFTRDYRFGTFQKYALVIARNAVKITGSGYSVLEAVTVPSQGSVAAYALGVAASLPRRPSVTAQKTSETVLIWGAGGSVGTYAVQYAAQAGYTVVATASTSTPGETERVKALGATHVIDYHQSTSQVIAALASYAPYTAVLAAVAAPTSLDVLSQLLVQTQRMRPSGLSIRWLQYTAYAQLGLDHEANGEFVDFVWQDWLSKGLEVKSVIPHKAQIVEGGLEKVQECLDQVLKAKNIQVVLKLTHVLPSAAFLDVFSDLDLAIAQQQQRALAARYQRERELARLHQQRIAMAQHQQVLHARRYEERRRLYLRQRQEAEAVGQAVSDAMSILQQLFSEGAHEIPLQTQRQLQSQPQFGSSTPTACQVRFSKATQSQEFHTAAPVAAFVAPETLNVETPSATSSPVRIPIREGKGKGSSHVRINSTASASSVSSSDADTSPADAFAALAILSTDLDGLVASSHVWQSEAHRRHALTQLLEQVDAVHSGGNDGVRDVRRALVQRVQHVLEDISDDQPRKEKAFEIREPVNVATSPPAPVQAPAEPEIASPAFSAFSAPAELQGYDVPDTLDAPFEEEERAVGLTSTNTESLVHESVNHQWSTEDPANANPTPRSSIFQLDIHNKVPDVSTREAAIVGSNSSGLDELVSAAVEATPLAVVAGDKTFEESPIVKPLTTAKQTAAERLSDWEDAKGGEEDTFELL